MTACGASRLVRAGRWAALIGVAAWGAVPAGPVMACGPFFPSSILAGDEAVLSSPVASFEHELSRIAPPPIGPLKANSGRNAAAKRQQTLDAGADDLRTALQTQGVDAERIEAIVLQWHEYRQAAEAWRDGACLAEAPWPEPPAVPAAVPAEFRLYLQGAAAFHAGDQATARAHWSAVLALPEAERRHRSIWAAYMLGRSLQHADPSAAAVWFQRTRSLAQEGFHDSTALAAASLGWEARLRLEAGALDQAMALYLAQWHAGDPSATVSLAVVARRALEGSEDTLMQVARDPLARHVVTAWLLARGGRIFLVPRPEEAMAHRWLASVEAAGGVGAPGTDRLAWAAYQAGRYDLAERWVAHVPVEAPIGRWVTAKLRMRAGDRPGAIDALAQAIDAFPVQETWSGLRWDSRTGIESVNVRPRSDAWAELGALNLGRGQYVEALDALLQSGRWHDAAYVADAVLTVDELLDHVQRGALPEVSQELPWQAEALRHLLARRLGRAARWQEARPFFPEMLQPVMDRYVDSLQRGGDGAAEAGARAEALWQAAEIARYHGLNLLATELDPDVAWLGGDFPFPSQRERLEATEDTLNAPDDVERQRVAGHRPVPDKRWHYRYVALDHAWEAIALMPDQDERTARRLVIAADWVKARDPQAADRFFKALITRCAQTDLGREALLRRWFPPLAAEGGGEAL